MRNWITGNCIASILHKEENRQAVFLLVVLHIFPDTVLHPELYICAAGRKLVFQRESTDLDRQGYYWATAFYRCENCAGCPYRMACCKAKGDGKQKELQIKPELLRLNSHSRESILTERGILLRMNRSIQVKELSAF